MLKSLHIENFRGFGILDVEGLARFNVIAGMNSVGKTALLEAVFCAGASEPSGLLLVEAQRGLPLDSQNMDIRALYENWFFDSARPLRIVSVNSVTGQRVATTARMRPASRRVFEEVSRSGLPDDVELISETPAEELVWELDREGTVIGRSVAQRASLKGIGIAIEIPLDSGGQTFKTVLLSAMHSRHGLQRQFDVLSDLKKSGQSAPLVAALRSMVPEVVDVEILVNRGTNTMAAALPTGRMVPLALLGDGVVRTMNILLAVEAAAGGRLCVDEIDNGLHHSVQTAIWKAIARLARERDVQVFATTHSYECIRAAHEAFADAPDDLKLIRLQRFKDGKVHVIAFRKEELDASLDMNAEVR